MESFATIVNSFYPLTIVPKLSSWMFAEDPDNGSAKNQYSLATAFYSDQDVKKKMI